MLENKKAIYQANYFYLNGKKRFDIWSQKEVDDKDTMQVKGELCYKSDYEHWYSRFTGCIFEVEGEKENNFLIKPIDKFIYPYLEEDSMLREYTYRYIDELRINNKEGI